MPETRETIVAAAVHIDGVTLSVPAPGRHHNVIWLMEKIGLDPTAAYPDRQGFLTSTGRFVSRFQARALAVRAKQIKEAKWPPDLYSEDLW